MRRIGFEATARINRRDFGVSWQAELPGQGVVVSNEIELSLDVEAIPSTTSNAPGRSTTTGRRPRPDGGIRSAAANSAFVRARGQSHARYRDGHGHRHTR
jgi:hypothetical protein